MMLSTDKNRSLGIVLARLLGLVSSPFLLFVIAKNKLSGSTFKKIEEAIIGEVLRQMPNEEAEILMEQLSEINYVSRSIFSRSAEICCYRIVPFWGPVRRRKRLLFSDFSAAHFAEIKFKSRDRSISAKLGVIDGAFFDIYIKGNINSVLDETTISDVQVDLSLRPYDPWASA